MVAIDVTLTASVNGGPPQQGGITCALDDEIQLSAVSKAGWGTNGPTKWQVVVMDPAFATPAGWTSNADGSYYCMGNDDPPTFTLNPWGKYAPSVIVNNGQVTDERTMLSVLSPAGVPGIGYREGSQFGGLVRRWLYSLNAALRAIADAAGFSNQGNPLLLATTGGPGTTSIGTRAGEQITIGSGTAGLEVTASGDTFFNVEAIETNCTSSFTVNSTDESAFTCDSFSVVAAGLCGIVADEFAVSAQSGAHLSAAVTPPVNAIGTVKIKGDSGVFVIPTAGGNGTRLDYVRVSKGNATTLEAGKVNELTGTAWTLPALSGVADGERVVVVHSLSTGTITRAGSDTINAGNGHTADTTFTLTDQQSWIVFQKVNGAWRVWSGRSANAAAGGGGGSSITDGTGTLGIASAGDLTTTGLDSVSLAAHSSGYYIDSGGYLSIETTTQAININSGAALSLDASTDAYISGDAGSHGIYISASENSVSLVATAISRLACPAVYWVDADNGVTPGVGGFGGWLWDVSGANIRGRFYDAAGSLSLTTLRDNAACVDTVVGTYRVDTTNCYVFLDTLQATLSGYNTYVSAGNEGGILAVSSARVSASSGPVTMESGTRKVTMGSYLGSPRLAFAFPVDTSISTATTTTCATFTPLARPSTYLVKVHLYDASNNASVWSVEVSALLNGIGGAVISGSPPTGAAATRTIGSPVSATLTIDASGSTIRVRVITTNTTGQTAAVTVTEIT